MRTRRLALVAVLFATTGMLVPERPGLFAGTATSPAEVPSTRHLALDRSSPEADETVASVERISLWFTQAPQMAGTSIRIVPEGGEPLDLGKAKMNESDDTLIELVLSEPLPPGTYGVFWRAMAQDGHTVRGDFSFTVRAGR